jgi:N-acetylmuramoyl-L-alanine amidase
MEYEVVEGDSVASLALENGVLPETIWNHPDNLDLRLLRKDMNVLMPGDILTIPEIQIADFTRPVDQMHRFQLKGALAVYRLQVFDVEVPRACQGYTLVVDKKITYKGTTDKSGTFEHKIPADSSEAELTIGEDHAQLSIRFGYLDPIDEVTGVKKRLRNLGFYAGEVDAVLDDDTIDALKYFQLRFGLPATGQIDGDTRTKLTGMHDVISEFPPMPDSANPNA